MWTRRAYCHDSTRRLDIVPMPETAKPLRDRIAHLRRLLSESNDADVSRDYLNEIVMIEAQLRELEGQKQKKPRPDG